MQRGPVDYLIKRFMSKENARVLYVLASCAHILFTFAFWAPMTHPIWDVQQPQLRMLIYGEYCFIAVYVAC